DEDHPAVGVGVVAEFVTGRHDGAGVLGPGVDVTAVEVEGGGDVQIRQYPQHVGGAIAGAVVEGERDDLLLGVHAVHERAGQLIGTGAHQLVSADRHHHDDHQADGDTDPSSATHR